MVVYGDRQFEWRSAILKIILMHDNQVNYDTLYNLIPKYIELHEHEWEPSGKVPEILWRGELRKYIATMRREGIIKTSIGKMNRRWHSVINPDEYKYIL